MSLFAKTPAPQLQSQPQPAVFENIALENGKALCVSHQEDLDSLYLNRRLFGSHNNIAACSKCSKPVNANAMYSAAFGGSSGNEICVVSPTLSKMSSLFPIFEKNPPLNFGNHVLEHVLWDTKADGYELNSLVYMKDQKTLAACSKNGSVRFWSIGDSFELIEPRLNLEKKINFAKYCVISDGKKYLAIGTDKGVHVYNTAEEGSYIRLLGVIDEDKIVSDLDFLKNERKIVTVYDDSTAKIWNLETLEMERTIDLHQYSIKGKIHKVMYMEKTGELAIEHVSGLSVIKDWQDKEGSVRHHFVDKKTSFGCKYLSNSRVFIMKNPFFVEILKEENFEEVRRYAISDGGLFGSDVSQMKFIASQDESVVISNGGSHFFSYKEENVITKHYLSHFIWGVSDIELIEDQYRIAVANLSKGTVSIFRVNAHMNIERDEGLSCLPAVSSSEQRFDSTTTATGGLLSGRGGNLFSGNSGSGGSLFSGRGGSLFSGKPSGGSLFSGNGGSGGGLFSRSSNPYSRNHPSRRNNIGVSSGSSSKKSTKAKPKPASKPVKKGKKIKKIQVRSKAIKKKEKVDHSSVKKEKKKTTKTTKTESLKKQKKTEQKKGMIEAVRIKGKKKTKEEKVWVVLPSAADDESEKKRVRGRSLKKTTKTKESKSSQNKKGKRKADVSEDKGSRSRSKSKSVTRKK